jgi:hypothetical protein
MLPGATVLQQGDTVLLFLSLDEGTQADLADTRQQLSDRFSGVDFVVVGGVSSVLVYPAAAQVDTETEEEPEPAQPWGTLST